MSLVGTFAVMAAFGFSINNLSLFGIVLAVGIVVDDAIVVVENVERRIEQGLSPRDATHKAMDEVTGPVIAIAFGLSAVFIPLAFISGITGQFYRQFALTIAFSTVISALNSLTLRPALAALLLRGHDAQGLVDARVWIVLLGWFFSGSTACSGAAPRRYAGGVRATRSRARRSCCVVYVGLLRVTWSGSEAVPHRFHSAAGCGTSSASRRCPTARPRPHRGGDEPHGEIALKHPA